MYLNRTRCMTFKFKAVSLETSFCLTNWVFVHLSAKVRPQNTARKLVFLTISPQIPNEKVNDNDFIMTANAFSLFAKIFQLYLARAATEANIPTVSCAKLIFPWLILTICLHHFRQIGQSERHDPQVVGLSISVETNWVTNFTNKTQFWRIHLLLHSYFCDHHPHQYSSVKCHIKLNCAHHLHM